MSSLYVDIDPIPAPAASNVLSADPMPTVVPISEGTVVEPISVNGRDQALEKRTLTLRDAANNIISVINTVDDLYPRRDGTVQKDSTAGFTGDITFNGHSILSIADATTIQGAVSRAQLRMIQRDIKAKNSLASPLAWVRKTGPAGTYTVFTNTTSSPIYFWFFIQGGAGGDGASNSGPQDCCTGGKGSRLFGIGVCEAGNHLVAVIGGPGVEGTHNGVGIDQSGGGGGGTTILMVLNSGGTAIRGWVARGGGGGAGAWNAGGAGNGGDSDVDGGGDGGQPGGASGSAAGTAAALALLTASSISYPTVLAGAPKASDNSGRATNGGQWLFADLPPNVASWTITASLAGISGIDFPTDGVDPTTDDGTFLNPIDVFTTIPTNAGGQNDGASQTVVPTPGFVALRLSGIQITGPGYVDLG